jgi:hypothetical protein
LFLVVLMPSLSWFFAPKPALAAGTLIAPTEGTITQYFLDQRVPDETGGKYYDYNDQLVTLPKNSKWHDGVDIAASGTDCTKQQGPVYAAGAGSVIFASYQPGFGWSVEIDHGQSVSSNGKYVFTLYGHMGTADPIKNKPGKSCLAVKKGQKVTAGQLVGYQGQSGNVTGVHLHWSVKVNPTTDSWKGSIFASPDFYAGLHLTIGNPPLLSSLTGHFQISPSNVSLTTTSGQNPSPQTLTMSNGGNGPLTWNLTSSLPSWLTVSPISGSLAPGVSQSITLTFSLPATAGTYSTTLIFNDQSADNSPASVPVNVTVVGWATVASPNLTSGGLSAVAEVSATDIWTVGNYLDTNNSNQPLTEHWDGNSWTMIPNPGSNGFLRGVTALASNDVWAVGQYYTNGAYQTLIENWNGSSWNIIPSPNNSARNNYLYSISGVFQNDIWAVGQYIPDAGGADQPLIEHWDGTSWTIVSSPDVGSGNDSSLESISYLLPNDIWAVGFTTNGYPNFVWTPLTEHYDGTSWHIVPSPTVNPANPWRLEGVMMFSSNNVWAVGAVYNNPPSSPVPDLIEHWDGNSWTIIQSPTVGTYDALFSISGTGSNDIWAAGYYADSSNIIHTLIKHWDGSAWNIVSSPDGASYRNDLYGIVAVASNDVWAVGDDQGNINALRQPLILRYH